MDNALKPNKEKYFQMSVRFLIQLLFITLLFSCKPNRKQQDVAPSKNSVDTSKTASIPTQQISSSTISNPAFDKNLLFGIWGVSNAPACEFEINEKRLLLCDHDGDGERFYKITGDSILLHNPSLTFRGKILKLTKDSLVVHWQNNKEPERLTRWTNQ
jgi:hypothetical protein